MRSRARTALLAALAGVLLAAGLVPGVGAAPADAASRITVTNEFGKAEADTTYSTPVTVRGTGYQSVKGGMGGIYVLFGWVDSGAWQPSKGGSPGKGSYRYVPDSEAKDNAGFQRYVAFAGSSTAESANGGVLGSDGSFTVQLTIPGPTFESYDRDGKVSTVDCRKVTCGILTIGAHGIANARNEAFTRVTFTDVFSGNAATPTPTPSPSSSPPAGADGEQAADGTPDVAVEPVEAAAIVDTTTAVVGHVLAFTGTGFTEGEHVLAVLDNGVAAVGPLTAGLGGALGGVLQLPAQVGVGTHTLTLTGATSGSRAEVNFPVRAAQTAVVEEEPADSWPAWLPSWPVLLVLALAVLALVAAVVWRVRSGRTSPDPAVAAPSAPHLPLAPGTISQEAARA